jgi:hypothetical protein
MKAAVKHSRVGFVSTHHAAGCEAVPAARSIDQLKNLLSNVKAWARHQRMVDLVQAMDDAQTMLSAAGRTHAVGVHHG